MDSSSGCGPKAADWSCPADVARDGSVSPSDRGASARGLPRVARLTARRQYLGVYERGVRVRRSSLTLFGTPNDVGICRLGITATKKCGGAVQRNRIKRVLRDIFRHHRARFDLGIDIVVNPRPGADFEDRRTIEREFVHALEQLVRRCRA